MDTIRIGKLTFHVLYPDLLRPLTPDEKASLKASIEKRGILSAIKVDENRGIIDGIHRATIAEELGMDYIPFEISAGLSPDEKLARARDLNLQGRLLTKKERQDARTGRKARVRAARAAGKSHRAIAKEEGISESQARRDSAGAPQGAPDTSGDESDTCESGAPDTEANGHANGKVIGLDGKTYPATKPAASGGAPPQVKAGSAKFDDRPIEKLLGETMRFLDRRSHVYGKSAEYQRCINIMRSFADAWEDWFSVTAQ